MFYQWKMEMDLTFEDETVLMTVKPQDQIVQPERVSTILKVKKCILQRWRIFLLKDLLSPFEWHSFCLTFSSEDRVRKVYLDNQPVLQDVLRSDEDFICILGQVFKNHYYILAFKQVRQEHGVP